MYYPYVKQATPTERRVMTVNGTGNFEVEPTIAQIQFEVRTENKDLSRAQQENAYVMNQVIESLLGLGISREDIKTSSYNIFPQYDYVEGKQLFRGYQVSNTITVKIRNIEQVGNVIDVAVQNGVNSVSSIQFMIENEELYYRQALSLALKDASAKAQTIAETMQIQFDPIPIKIVEEGSGGPIAFQSFAAKETSVSTPIEPGQITISATVNVQFQY
ncbi:SIMPL domain-containing protein [Filibacter tadaridae]|uniref:26 kDa periplasmic immunogenic protein n=1 Tax=Filibacter tadaridae TaxID=2483811 RepID=A0A3P5X1R7_9BACL|nr:SIMPL domain-containing protein [Filibacter tadaridae]VDC28070.1 26 kDa periplasmic immunogenic protein precursor [Filibacter tadaridae]